MMSDAQQPDTSTPDDRPGKTRTWWHPLLVRLLDFALSSAFTVVEEVLVGKMPLRVDILLIRRQQGELSEYRRQELSSLVPLLGRYTLVEFKGPTDVLQRGDLAQLAGCSFLWHSQQSEPVQHDEVSLIVLAPRASEAIGDEIRLLGWEAVAHEPGVLRVAGAPFATWLVETDVMAERGQPVLALVSRVFLDHRERIIEELMRTGHAGLLHYMVQQIQQFRSLGEDFAMQHVYSEDLQEMEEQLLTKMLESIPPERRLRGLPPEERLRGLPPEERVRGLPPEERVRGLSLEERLAGLSEEDAARLRDLLEQRRPTER